MKVIFHFLICFLIQLSTVRGVALTSKSQCSGGGIDANGLCIIPNSFDSIDPGAFSGDSTLTAIDFTANTVLTIGTAAFQGTKLTSVTFPNSLTSIGTAAFFQISTLTSVSFGAPSVLTTIGNYAFQGTSLTSVTLPSTLTDTFDPNNNTSYGCLCFR